MKLKYVLTLAALIAFGAMIFLAREEIVETLKRLDDVNPLALLAMIPIQLFSYHAVTRMYQEYFGAIGDKIRYWSLYKTSLEMNFVNQVFPSGGVSGVSYLSYRMSQFGISYAKSTLAQIVRFGLTFVTFQMMLFAGLVILIARGKGSTITVSVTFAIALLVTAATFLAIYIIKDRRRIKVLTGFIAKNINRFANIFQKNNDKSLIDMDRVKELFGELHDDYRVLSKNWFRSFLKPGWYSLLANLAEVTTIYVVYVAFGEWVNFGAVIIAYAVANFAGAIAVLPGGIGVYESLMTIIMVSAGVPAELSLVVTVMYRVLNMLTFLPIGYYFYHKAIQEHGNGKPAQSA